MAPSHETQPGAAASTHLSGSLLQEFVRLTSASASIFLRTELQLLPLMTAVSPEHAIRLEDALRPVHSVLNDLADHLAALIVSADPGNDEMDARRS